MNCIDCGKWTAPAAICERCMKRRAASAMSMARTRAFERLHPDHRLNAPPKPPPPKEAA